MKTTLRSSLAAALSLAALSLWLAPAAPAAGVHFTAESLQQAQAQINANQVHAATFNKKAHTLHLTLNDGRHVLASYPSHNEPQLAAQLQAHGITAVVKKPKKKATHHRLRYIAGGVLIVVILIVALVLGLNRRRPREGEAPGAPGGAAPAPSGGAAPPAPAAPEEPPAQ